MVTRPTRRAAMQSCCKQSACTGRYIRHSQFLSAARLGECQLAMCRWADRASGRGSGEPRAEGHCHWVGGPRAQTKSATVTTRSLRDRVARLAPGPPCLHGLSVQELARLVEADIADPYAWTRC